MEIGKNISRQICEYWTKRTEDFNKVRLNELHGEISNRWLSEFRALLPAGKPLKILDAGTGTGYFAILLAREGHEVTGIDLTPSMLEAARRDAELFGVNAEFVPGCRRAQNDAKQFGVSALFVLMDVQETNFESDSFDAVVSRNVTWTLPDPEKAYVEWYRVLKPGGILLNFDANYADNVRHENQKESWIKPDGVYGHVGMTTELMQENAKITLSVPASLHHRPGWDVELAKKIGFSTWGVDETLGKRILQENDMSDAPMFLFWARK